MKIAIITGASSGLGNEFVYQIDRMTNDIDEIWVISRNIQSTQWAHTKASIVPIPMDITSENSQYLLLHKLIESHAKVKVLVNSAGFGKVGEFLEIDMNEQLQMIDCNCKALVALTYKVIPYMVRGGYVINVASSAAFFPQVKFSIYAASKAFVLSFSRSLNHELLKNEISVTAVCPGPVDTPFFERAESEGKERLGFKNYFMAKPKKVVYHALICAKNRREIAVYGLFIKCFHIMCKVVPHSILLKIYDIMQDGD